MNDASLHFISESVLQNLRENVSLHRDRYKSKDFADLAAENGWQIESKLVSVDYAALASLDGSARTSQIDAKNSKIVYDALQGMTPALAMDERVWVRLSHLECLEYSRARWLPKIDDEEKFDEGILKHFFARGVPGARDDNAISRLWWNMHIAVSLDEDREKGEEYLNKLLRLADIRQAFVERSWTGARAPLARAILRTISDDSWASKDKNFRQLMIEINREGGGILFETLSENFADEFVAMCSEKANLHLELKAQGGI